MKGKLLLITVLCCLMCSCSSVEDKSINSVMQKLKDIRSYTCDVNMKETNNKTTMEYSMKHYYTKDKNYRVEVVEPEEFKGQYTIYNENKICIYDPVSKHKLIKPVNDGNTYETLLGSLFAYEGYIKKAAYEKEIVDGKTYYTMKCTIPRDNEYLKEDKLFINFETGIPEKIVIYDSKGSVSVELKFSNFKFNERLDKNLFDIKE